MISTLTCLGSQRIKTKVTYDTKIAKENKYEQYMYIQATVIGNSVSVNMEVWRSLLPTSNIALWQNSFVINRIYIYVCVCVFVCVCVGRTAQSAKRLTRGWTIRYRFPLGSRFSARPDRKICTGCFPSVKCGRGVMLTTHPILVPRSWKSRDKPLPILWATPGLKRDHFNFIPIYIYIYIYIYAYIHTRNFSLTQSAQF